MPGQAGGRSGRGRSKSGGSNGGFSGNTQLVESVSGLLCVLQATVCRHNEHCSYAVNILGLSD